MIIPEGGARFQQFGRAARTQEPEVLPLSPPAKRGYASATPILHVREGPRQLETSNQPMITLKKMPLTVFHLCEVTKLEEVPNHLIPFNGLRVEFDQRAGGYSPRILLWFSRHEHHRVGDGVSQIWDCGKTETGRENQT